MRPDSLQFARGNEAPSKRPRYVVAIFYDVESIYCTSHADIPNVPGVVIQSVLKVHAAFSQRLIPDEGRTEIGSFDFTLIDRGGSFTSEQRRKLAQGMGLRGKVVQFWAGFEGDDFSAFQLFTTQIVQDASEENGSYTIECADITREQRQDVFEPVYTTLRDSIAENPATIPVYDTSKFKRLAHGSSWSDAPNQTVGYVRINDTVYRYTGTTPDSFTGVTAGVLSTKAVAQSIDASTAADRRPKVEEFVYLELPAVKLAYAILTGQLYGTANTLPSHWHLGIDPSFVRVSDFLAIGGDLWVPSDDSAALVLRFESLKKTDGKRFLEKEIYLLLGCYSPVYADGTVGLRRMPSIVRDSASLVTLTEREIIRHGELKHDFSGMHNAYRVDWNWNANDEEFTRITLFEDATSVAIHGTAPIKQYSFKGLHGSRHTDAIVRSLLNGLRDAYAYPPQRLSVTVPGALSRFENGDIVRVKSASLRDSAGPGPTIDRAFLVLSKSHDTVQNSCTYELFGSTLRPSAEPSTTDPTSPLPDAFYNATGTPLSAVLTINSNVVPPGNYVINGYAELNAAGAVFYHLNDLTISDGARITVTGNVQLRIRGHLSFNGAIDGTGGGRAGVTDSGASPWDQQFPGNSGFVGHSRGWDGIRVVIGPTPPAGAAAWQTLSALLTNGQNDSFPFLQLSVSESTLLGLPADLRGTGGPPGGRMVGDIIVPGGPGAAGGAGLCVISRGLSFGASAVIRLNGANPAATTQGSFFRSFPGVGGAGGPGALLILLDGSSLSVPDITGKFFAVTGTVTQPGTPMENRQEGGAYSKLEGRAGYPDPSVISAQDGSNAAHRIQYVPESQTATPDEDSKPPAPTTLSAASSSCGNTLSWTPPFSDLYTVIEIYASIDSNRQNAVKVGEVKGSSFFHVLPLGGLRYYWIRARRDIDSRPSTYSDWEPSAATDGESSNIETPGEIPDEPYSFVAQGMVNGIQFRWSLPNVGRLLGFVELFENETYELAGARVVWSGYAVGYFLVKTDRVPRYYWIRLTRGGEPSIAIPTLGAQPVAASGLSSALLVTTLPTSLSESAGLPPPSVKTATTRSCNATATGGNPPYSYAWTWASGGAGITIGSPNSAATNFSGSHVFDGTTLSGIARCTVTDIQGATSYDDVSVALVWPSVS